MKLVDCQKNKDDYTGLTSGLVRQLAFAAIAIIWIFKYDKPVDHLLPHQLVLPLFIIIISLALDFLQYLVLSCLWIRFFKRKEKELGCNSDEYFEAPSSYPRTGYVFYYLKIIALFCGYFFIIKYLITKL
jgi:hypothetical protein